MVTRFVDEIRNFRLMKKFHVNFPILHACLMLVECVRISTCSLQFIPKMKNLTDNLLCDFCFLLHMCELLLFIRSTFFHYRL